MKNTQLFWKTSTQKLTDQVGKKEASVVRI